MKIVFFGFIFENRVGSANTIKTGRTVGSGLIIFWMKREGERGWMKPPLPFSNKGILILLLVLLFRVGISSHPVLFLDPFGEVDLGNGDIGGCLGEHPPLSGVGLFGGRFVWECCGGNTPHTTRTHVHVHSEHVDQTCLQWGLFREEREGAWRRMLGGNTSYPSKNTILTFGCYGVRVCRRMRDLWGG